MRLHLTKRCLGDFVSELAGRRNAKLAINWNAHVRDRMRSLVAVIRIGRPSVRQLNVRPRPDKLSASWSLFPRAGLVTLISGADQ